MIKSLSRKPGFALAALAVAVATAAPAVSAQEELEEVIVTGSRIPVDSNAVSSVPIQAVSEEDIRNSGEINIADIVADIPCACLLAYCRELINRRKQPQPSRFGWFANLDVGQWPPARGWFSRFTSG